MPHAKPDPVKHCEVCGVLMKRKRFNGRLEDYGVFLRRRRCSQSCANTKQTLTLDGYRSRARRKTRQTHCTSCGTTERLHVHHIDRNPVNNEPTNLEVLCGSCHMLLHWREDRDKRLAAARKGGNAAARRTANMRPRSTDGRFCSADQHRRQPSPDLAADSA